MHKRQNYEEDFLLQTQLFTIQYQCPHLKIKWKHMNNNYRDSLDCLDGITMLSAEMLVRGGPVGTDDVMIDEDDVMGAYTVRQSASEKLGLIGDLVCTLPDPYAVTGGRLEYIDAEEIPGATFSVTT